MPTQTAEPILTKREAEREHLIAEEEAAEAATRNEFAELQPDAEAAVAGIVNAARALYAALETYRGVDQRAQEIQHRRWGGRRADVPSHRVPLIDKAMELRDVAENTVINPPPVLIPGRYLSETE